MGTWRNWYTRTSDMRIKISGTIKFNNGHVAELVYAYVSEAYLARVGSSSLPVPTRYFKYSDGLARTSHFSDL